MFAFIHIPKTAGTTLRSVLRRSFSADFCDARSPVHCRKTTPWLNARNLKLVNLLYPKLKGISGHRVCCFTDLNDAMPGVQYITFLRDPIQRFISGFHHEYRGRIEECTVENLALFAEQPKNRNMQTRWICGEEDGKQAIQVLDSQVGLVGLTEKFDESLLLLMQWLNDPQFKINYISRNFAYAKAPLPYAEDPSLLKIIQDANLHDIELYQHVVDNRFPKQVSAYGGSFNSDLSDFLSSQEVFEDFPEPKWSKVKRNLIYKPFLHLPWV